MYPQHGQTENQNEMFNPMIWYTVPKHAYVGLLNDTLLEPVYMMQLHIAMLETLLHWENLNLLVLSLELPSY